MKTFLKSILATALLAGLAQAAPVRYVQISTNAITQQSGNANFQGATISTVTITSATITNGTITNLSLGPFSVSSATITNFTASASTSTNINTTNLVASTITVTNLVYKQRQIVSYVTTSSDTTKNTYINSGLSGTISPTATTRAIKITVNGALRTANAGAADAIATIRRGNTDLAAAGLGFTVVDQTVSLAAPMVWIDTGPFTAGATTYFASFKNDDNVTSVFFGAAGLTSVMVLEEIP